MKSCCKIQVHTKGACKNEVWQNLEKKQSQPYKNGGL